MIKHGDPYCVDDVTASLFLTANDILTCSCLSPNLILVSAFSVNLFYCITLSSAFVLKKLLYMHYKSLRVVAPNQHVQCDVSPRPGIPKG